jgi:hypothetical protein
LSHRDKSKGEPIRYEKTKAGLQGVLLTVQPTQDKLGAIRSDIPLSEQIKGTMFEQKKQDEPTLFDEKTE